MALAVERSQNGDYTLKGAFWSGTEKDAAPTFAKFCQFNAYDLALEVARAEARQNLERGLPDVAFAPAQSKNMNAYRKEKAWFEEIKYEEATPENRAFLDATAKTMFRGEYCLEGLDAILREVGTKAISLAIATAVDGYRVAHWGEAPRIPAFLASKKDDPLYPSVASVAEGYRALLNPTSARLIGPDSLGAPRRLAATAKAFYDAGAPEEAEWFQRAAWDVLKRFYGEPYQTQATEHAEAIETLRRLPKQLGDEEATLLLFEENDSAKQEEESIKRRFNSVRLTAGTREVLKVNGFEYAFRYCPPGTFLMGSPASEAGRSDDETQHRVELTNGFWILETPVTVGMQRSFVKATEYRMGDGLNGEGGLGVDSSGEFRHSLSFTWENPGFPNGFRQTDDHPATQIDWAGAVAFCDWLAKESGAPVRLPTEAEWEYACRAGTTTPFFWGATLNGDKANCNGKLPYGGVLEGSFLGHTSAVGSYPANDWGLYDMHGNVFEWCADWLGAYGSGSQTDPTGPTSGSRRVLRGGSWGVDAVSCRSAIRGSCNPTARSNFFGFRLVLGR